MFKRIIGMFGIGKYVGIVGAIALAICFAWGYGYKIKYEKISAIATSILYEIREASGKDNLKLKDAAQEVKRVAASRDDWRQSSGEWQVSASQATQTIERVEREQRKLKALNAKLRAKAEIEIKKRETLIDQLEDRALDPGKHEDCVAQIEAANRALDQIFEANL